MSSANETKTNLPLPQFYARALRALLPIVDGATPISEPETQTKLKSAVDDLYLVGRMLSSLGVFSDNESIDELGERELVFMTVGWALGEAEGRGGLGGPDDRKATLQRSDTAFNSFLNVLETYKVLPEGEQGDGARAVPTDPARRREAKIAAHRRSKELREKIATALPGHPDSSSNPIEFILALLPGQATTTSVSVNEEEADTRAPTLLLLRLLADEARSSLANNAMELTILAQAPPEPSQGPLEDPRSRRTTDEDTTWRLDRPAGSYKPRELISGGGRVLRPFTILPSTTAMSDRERLRSEVFRSGHRLPTMTIDEYLAEEDARGNIIRGGGQASYDAPTESELLELEAENDGTVKAYEAAEKKRAKDENWAQFTDENQKGAGNTMNRG